ncbi:MAG: flavodoxin domain-containing protein [Candidatus Bathyarchaeota archaeon]|jgi:flavodoxin|nr:flavodoxin domain-containing protein [Candidatus Bathyarchaeota archaeon]|tara:strand:+ start:384 stop:845 length:462 start_codon:yes stop_codon:yes gene_type:complete
MKVMVIYDSKTGNTEKMAKAVAEGAGFWGASVEIKKIGEPFPLSRLEDSDGTFFGSPCNYANVTPAMRSFLENLKGAVDIGKVKLKGKKAAVFGTYGWDGAWVMEQKFNDYVRDLGYKVEQDACVEVGTDLQYHPDVHLSECREWAKKFTEAL